MLTNRVHGEIRPFSFAVYKTEEYAHDSNADAITQGDEVFVVREQLFEHNGRFYMLASHPEGKSWSDYVDNFVRYISRLTKTIR